MSAGNLEPFSPLYVGREKLIATWEARRVEAERQVDYWTEELANHGDSFAMSARFRADHTLGIVLSELNAIHDYPHCYPIEPNRFGIV